MACFTRLGYLCCDTLFMGYSGGCVQLQQGVVLQEHVYLLWEIISDSVCCEYLDMVRS